MGRIQETVEIVFAVSNHNSEQDAIDRAAVARLRGQVYELIDADPELAEIFVDLR